MGASSSPECPLAWESGPAAGGGGPAGEAEGRLGFGGRTDIELGLFYVGRGDSEGDCVS